MKKTILLLLLFLSKFSFSQTLYINVIGKYETSSDFYQTMFYIDSIYNDTIHHSLDGDYGSCSMDPSLHLVVMDKNICRFYSTNCDLQFEIHSFNQMNACGCRPFRADKYFIFKQNDSLQLTSLSHVISDSLEDNQLFFIYSSNGYNLDTIMYYSPQLVTTMNNIWGLDVVSNHQAALFLAKKNQVNSYYSEVYDEIEAEIHYSRPVCSLELANLTYINKDSDLTLYPNPIDNILYLNNPNKKQLSAEIYDLQGKIKLTQIGFESFDASNLNSGIYLIKIKTDNDIIVKTFVKN